MDQSMASIAEATHTARQNIKVQESYGSNKYFTVSKHATVEKIELPEGFRKIQKVYEANNAFLNSLDDYKGSTFSNAHSTCKVMTVSYAPYAVALVWSYFYLLLDQHYSNLTDDALTSVLLIPSLLGGSPAIYLHNMHVRAESDLLSPFIDICRYCERHYPAIWDHLKPFLRQKVVRRIDYATLYADPYSLPIRKPPTPALVLRKNIIPELKRVVKNKNITELIRSAESTTTQNLVKVMEGSLHQPVWVFSVIYSALAIGVLSELTRRFEMGKSVLELIMVGRREGRKRGMQVI